MANLNKVMLIGRLTRDPESRTFANGGKVTKIGFAVNNRKKNPQTGQWEEVPVYVDVKAFNRGEFGRMADTIEQYCRKGHQLYIEGHLLLEEWEDKNSGGKRNRLVVIMDNFQFLEKAGGGDGGRGPARSGSSGPPPAYEAGDPGDDLGGDYGAAAGAGQDNSSIPF